MSGVDVRIVTRIGGFVLDAAFGAPGRGVTALFGASGAGKTSILRCIAGLDRPRVGRIAVRGEVWQDSAANRFVPTHRRPLGFVFQDAALFPMTTVRGNLRYGYRRTPPGRRRVRFDDVVDWLGLGAVLDRRPVTLSGGERQRVAIARAVLAAPRVLLLDEPLASIDETRKGEILPYLETLHGVLDIPVLYVSHARSEVLRLADHVVLIENGRVQGAGPIAEFATHLDHGPVGADEDIAAVAEATALAVDDRFGLTRFGFAGGEVEVPVTGIRPGDGRRLRFLARDVSIVLDRPARTSILNVLPATVVEIRRGASTLPLVVLDTGGTRLLARITRRSVDHLDLRPGTRVFAQIKGVALVS